MAPTEYLDRQQEQIMNLSKFDEKHVRAATNSDIISSEEIEVHGTAELRTERLILRRYRPEDAELLYRYLGTDPEMYQYSGWNPYATLEMSGETVQRFIDSVTAPHARDFSRE